MYLNCHTYYSLRYGTFPEGELLALAAANNVTRLGLTDINSTTAALSFLHLAKGYGIQVTVGVDIRNGIAPQYLLIAKSNKGFQEINTFLSAHLHLKKPFPPLSPKLEDVFAIYPFEQVLELEKSDFSETEFIGLSIQNIAKLKFSKYKNFKEKLVVQQPVTFRGQADYNAHRLLRCIDLNILLSKLPENEQANKKDCMVPVEELEAAYVEFPSALENTRYIFENCSVTFGFDEERENQNQDCYLASKEEDFGFLKKLTYENLPKRYPTVTEVLTERIERELKAIREMDFVSYFLINYDIIQYAISKDYPFIGRGSGANSVVAYIIGITNVDPIELDLYFERFINVYRSSPPDFDIDFSWKDRDDVTRYIFERFPNTALMGTYVTFQYRAVIRELGKVFGLPKAEIDAFIKGHTVNDKNDSYFKLIQKYGKLIHGFPNYLSVHSGGILITKKPIPYYIATFMPPKGFRTVQFDMNIAEEAGIFKFDILAQRGLSKIKDTVAILKYNQPEAEVADLEDVKRFKEDPAINTLLETGDCMGVFYVESPAMRGLMTKLQTRDYLGLVAASSIIRPGVSNGGMKEEYIIRHRHPERRKNGHPVMMEILHETYGVMVYQEDVLKVAHIFAGLSLAEADILRRGMSGKKRSVTQFETLEAKFFRNCLAKGYTEELTCDVWEQIKSFAGYAFAKGHSASYAVESYQSLYLKKYFPLEFMTAVLNNGGGFYNIETYLHEIRVQGGTVELPCINRSDHANAIYGTAVYLGLGMLLNMEWRTVQKILTERQLNGRYRHFDDFTERVVISMEQLILLIRIDAFRFTGMDKHRLLWQTHLKFHKGKAPSDDLKLFTTPQIKYKIPEIKSDRYIDAYDQIELLGFPLCSYFELLENPVKNKFTASRFPEFVHKKVEIYGKLVTAKSTKTNKGERMYFGTFLDVEGTFFDTVHFPEISKKFSIKSNGVYKITGKVTEEAGYYSLIVESAFPQPLVGDPRYSETNNRGKNIIKT